MKFLKNILCIIYLTFPPLLFSQDIEVILNQTIKYEPVGAYEIVFDFKVVNISAVQQIVFEVRTINYLPSGWSSSLCFGELCFAPEIDSIATAPPFPEPPLNPGDTLDTSVHIFTDMMSVDSSHVQLEIGTFLHPEDRIIIDFYAITTGTAGGTVTVVSPNGGEVWQVGSINDIQWNSTDISNLKIDYSTNNGGSWSLISPSVPANSSSYAWTIPNTISSLCKVRLSDANNLITNDQSDSAFSIIQYPSITVQSPNGGEILEGTLAEIIEYNSNAVDSVMMHYSTNAGISWALVFSSLPAIGTIEWEVPNIGTEDCLIKITDIEDVNNYDVSNSVFEILEVSWYHQNSNVVKKLNSIDMSLPPTVGFICGDDGTLIKTTNGGDTWEILATGIAEDFYSIKFFSENIGWVVGQNGLVLMTTNGGLSWNYQNTNTNSTLYSTYFLAQTGWVVGSEGIILKTSDMGNNRYFQQSNVSFSLNSIFFHSTDIGWVVGNSGTYLKTTNGGINWIQKTVGTSNNLSSIFFIDSQKGWIVGTNGTILLTVDGGEVWINVSPYATNLNSVFFTGYETGFTVGDGGIIYKSTDGGYNWYRIGSGLSQLNYDLYEVDFSNLAIGWAIGENGTILKTTNGGSSYISTTLTSIALVGSYILEVESTSGFSTTAQITINPGGENEETNIVTSTGFGTLNLLNPLQSNHQIGEPVINFVTVSVQEEETKEIPTFYNLSYNYPNPFNPTTLINYHIPELSFVTLKVFDVLGNEVATLVNEEKPIGSYEVEFDATGIPSGVYFYRLQAGSFVETKKMVLMK